MKKSGCLLVLFILSPTRYQSENVDEIAHDPPSDRNELNFNPILGFNQGFHLMKSPY